MPESNIYLCTRGVIILVLIGFHQADAVRCFQCDAVPYPRDCTRIVTCSSNDVCYTEQLVTASGNIMYNSGCQSKSHCGQRSNTLVGRRFSDITICKECCNGDYCNNQGCGTKAVERDARGPYCFKCNSELNPAACENVAVCLPNQHCLLYSPIEYTGLPEKIYRSTCDTKLRCETLSNIHGDNHCSCCNTDFCNDHCNKSTSSGALSTPLAQTTVLDTTSAIVPTKPISTSSTTLTTTPAPSTATTLTTTPAPSTATTLTTTPAPSTATTLTTTPVPSTATTLRTTPTPTDMTGDSSCSKSGNYKSVYVSAGLSLCIHILNDESTWFFGKIKCHTEGGDLVVIDTREKAEALQTYLKRVDETRSETFWIGANFKNGALHWVNGNLVTYADWDIATHEPVSANEGCVSMYGFGTAATHFWHAEKCSVFHYPICQRN